MRVEKNGQELIEGRVWLDTHLGCTGAIDKDIASGLGSGSDDPWDAGVSDIGLDLPTARGGGDFDIQRRRACASYGYAGIGRTGLVAACVAKDLLGLSGRAAIQGVRRDIAGAVESPVQREMLRDDDADCSAPCQPPPPRRVSG